MARGFWAGLFGNPKFQEHFMRTILSLFAKSPFKPLSEHMNRVSELLELVMPLMEGFIRGDSEKVRDISENIMKIEHEADVIKQKIRDSLPKSLFLPVDRKDFMQLLTAQDDLADAVEDLAVVTRFKVIDVPEQLKDQLTNLSGSVVDIGHEAIKILKEIVLMMESSFSGPEAEKVSMWADKIGSLEWKADKLQFKYLQEVFGIENELDKGTFYILIELTRKLGSIADKSEKIGKILKLFLCQ